MSTDLTISSASLPDRMQFAKALAASDLVPVAFRGKPANILLATEYGNALGIAPAVALSEINVIQGTPTLSAAMMAALAREAGHRVRVTGDAESATCTILRADDPDFEHTATWTKKKAQDAGLWGRGHWSKDPGTMLRWRAISECVRFACPEVLGGLKYTPDEVVSFKGGDDPTPLPEVHEDDLTDVTDAEVVEDEPEDIASLASEPQRRKLFALFARKGVTEEQQRKGIGRYMGLDGPVESRSEVTAIAAARFIEWLEQQPDAESD